MTQYELITLFAKYGNLAFKLSAANQLFMMTLISYWNHETNECYPSNESVLNGCGIDPSNLSKNKKVLVQAGLIKTYNKPMGDKKKHSGYVINVDFIVSKLNEAAQQIEQLNIVKFKESGADPFAQEEQEQIAPWEIEEPTLDTQKCVPIEKVIEEATTAHFCAEPEPEPTGQICLDEPNADISAIEPTANFLADEPEQEEKPMTIVQDDLEKMMEEAKRLRLERQERIAKREQEQNQSSDSRSPW
ncbi:helix-turn-helix domain-containing protein [Salmonella enterica]|nr:helix-turn-helix domain-containing protein [Salmonella enterica]